MVKERSQSQLLSCLILEGSDVFDNSASLSKDRNYVGKDYSLHVLLKLDIAAGRDRNESIFDFIFQIPLATKKQGTELLRETILCVALSYEVQDSEKLLAITGP